MIKMIKKLFSKEKGPDYYLSSKWMWHWTKAEHDFLKTVEHWPWRNFRTTKVDGGSCTSSRKIEPSLNKRLLNGEGRFNISFPLVDYVDEKYFKHRIVEDMTINEHCLDYWSYYYGVS